jgi:long-subunit acyl-CoA synthetase (AMP-forming)
MNIRRTKRAKQQSVLVETSYIPVLHIFQACVNNLLYVFGSVVSFVQDSKKFISVMLPHFLGWKLSA